MVGSSTPLTTGFESLAVAALLFGVGYLVADLVTSRTRIDSISKIALAFPGLVAFALVLMFVHIATRGFLLSSRVAVWAVVGVAAIALLAWRFVRRHRDSSGPDPAGIA